MLLAETGEKETSSSRGRDEIADTLSKNMGSDWKVTRIHQDKEFGIYILYHKDLPSATLVHLHDLTTDVGTTYTVGDDNLLKGRKSSHLSSSELQAAVGKEIFREIWESKTNSQINLPVNRYGALTRPATSSSRTRPITTIL